LTVLSSFLDRFFADVVLTRVNYKIEIKLKSSTSLNQHPMQHTDRNKRAGKQLGPYNFWLCVTVFLL